MSASQLPAVQATALQAVARLQLYEEHLRQLVGSWLDMELYQSVSAEVDNIRASCAILPGLAIPIAALVVSHADLVHCLWRNSQPGSSAGIAECDTELQEHLGNIHSLSRKCLRAAGRPDRAQ
ncbi:hypothetical protein HHL11_25945 [Ramlibacter sp. G-1-2-2]|uniref:Uncharacterized protein n=1 Tax=Ramlibacter agri TaxID=2728837 RepID=A0A848H8A2_9BURK|nr:hypothetical protein [Ramlibacter agri]NML47216.1 hypothetical protein [Ramlibacter agri]